eukprot:5781018-Amphidinium_carterae.1
MLYHPVPLQARPLDAKRTANICKTSSVQGVDEAAWRAVSAREAVGCQCQSAGRYQEPYCSGVRPVGLPFDANNPIFCGTADLCTPNLLSASLHSVW